MCNALSERIFNKPLTAYSKSTSVWALLASGHLICKMQYFGCVSLMTIKTHPGPKSMCQYFHSQLGEPALTLACQQSLLCIFAQLICTLFVSLCSLCTLRKALMFNSVSHTQAMAHRRILQSQFQGFSMFLFMLHLCAV